MFTSYSYVPRLSDIDPVSMTTIEIPVIRRTNNNIVLEEISQMMMKMSYDDVDI